MEKPSTENSKQLSDTTVNADHQQYDNALSDALNHGVTEQKQEMNEEEVRGALEAIASTGKGWHDWEKLKSMLSFHLKQVLSEYPEAKMTGEQQNGSLGETFPELVNRLDEAIHSFVEGPPFTVQRICEILLDARGIYPNLSKLALALEKNLLVTSMLTVCDDPSSPSTTQKPDDQEKEKEIEKPQVHTNAVENGIEPIEGDRDEVMAEVEEADVNDDMTIDMEAFEEIVGPSETASAPTEGHD